MKSQFKRADASQARFALIFGQDEVSQGMVAIKPLRAQADGTAEAQRLVALSDVADWASVLTSP
jgi:histidyl-tRNA synthetase